MGILSSVLHLCITNYTQCFSKMGYKIIQQTFDKPGVEYMNYTIKQAKYLKLDLEWIVRKEAIGKDGQEYNCEIRH